MSASARAAVRRTLRKERSWLKHPDKMRAKLHYVMFIAKDKNLEGLIEIARTDPDAWAALRDVIADHFSTDEPLPSVLRDFLLEVVEGKQKQPGKPRGRDSKANHVRNFLIALAARTAMEADETLCLSRNDATEDESASDIVSQELKKLTGISLSPDSVGRIAVNHGVALKHWFAIQSKRRVGKK